MATQQRERAPIKTRLYERREDVIRGVIRRRKSGASMKSSVVLVEDRPLARAAIRLFQNWGNALRAAGMDAEVVLRRRKWTPAKIVERIQDLAHQGVALNQKSVAGVDKGCWSQRISSWARGWMLCGKPVTIRTQSARLADPGRNHKSSRSSRNVPTTTYP